MCPFFEPDDPILLTLSIVIRVNFCHLNMSTCAVSQCIYPNLASTQLSPLCSFLLYAIKKKPTSRDEKWELTEVEKEMYYYDQQDAMKSEN